MEKIIDRRVYNTETGVEIAYWSNGGGRSDFSFCEETIYRSPKGRYFLHGEGGAASKYAVSGIGFSSGGEDISLLDEDAVIDKLVEWGEVEIVKELFPDSVEEG